MKGKDIFWTAAEAVIWYFFAYYALYAIKNPVNLWTAALVLLVLGTVGIVACPWFRRTPAWKELMGSGKKEAKQDENSEEGVS